MEFGLNVWKMVVNKNYNPDYLEQYVKRVNMEFKMFHPLGLYVKRHGYGWYRKFEKNNKYRK